MKWLKERLFDNLSNDKINCKNHKTTKRFKWLGQLKILLTWYQLHVLLPNKGMRKNQKRIYMTVI